MYTGIDTEIMKRVISARKTREMLSLPLRVSRKRMESIAQLVFTIIFTIFVVNGVIRRSKEQVISPLVKSVELNTRYVSVDGDSSKYRIENKYIVYVDSDQWGKHFRKISRLMDVEVFSTDSPVGAYFCHANPITIYFIRRMPEVVRIEQDQLYPSDEIDLYAGHSTHDIFSCIGKFSCLMEKHQSFSQQTEDFLMDTPTPIIQKTDSWALDKLSYYGNVPDEDNYTHRYYDRDGKNVVVYIGDSYIMRTLDNNHSLSHVYRGVVSETIIKESKLVNHATQVASLISGKKYGVAKRAEIVGVVMTEKTGLYYSNVIRALYYIVNDYKRRLKMESVGKTSPKAILTLTILMPYKFWGFEQLYKKLLDLGIFIILSAGNQSKVPCDSSMYADPGVLVVGASTIDNKKASFSNYGSCVRVYSPGENVKSIGINDVETVTSGTSFSAPLVTGILASLISDPMNSQSSASEIIRKMLLCAEEYEDLGLPEKKILLINRSLECLAQNCSESCKASSVRPTFVTDKVA